MMWVAETKLCAGFLSMQAICDDRLLPKGFVPSTELVYEDWIEMADAYGYFDYINQKNAKD